MIKKSLQNNWKQKQTENYRKPLRELKEKRKNKLKKREKEIKNKI